MSTRTTIYPEAELSQIAAGYGLPSLLFQAKIDPDELGFTGSYVGG